MGDCAGSPFFTHVGEDDARVVLSNLDGGSRTTRDRLIPYCLFIDPELAHVGWTESEAKAKGVSSNATTVAFEKSRRRTVSLVVPLSAVGVRSADIA